MKRPAKIGKLAEYPGQGTNVDTVSLLARCRILAHIEDEIRDLRDAIDWTTCTSEFEDDGYPLSCFQHTGEWATACEPCKANKARMVGIKTAKAARRRAIVSICKLVKSSAYQWTGGAKA